MLRKSDYKYPLTREINHFEACCQLQIERVEKGNNAWKKRKYSGTVRTIMTIVREEGVRVSYSITFFLSSVIHK